MLTLNMLYLETRGIQLISGQKINTVGSVSLAPCKLVKYPLNIHYPSDTQGSSNYIGRWRSIKRKLLIKN